MIIKIAIVTPLMNALQMGANKLGIFNFGSMGSTGLSLTGMGGLYHTGGLSVLSRPRCATSEGSRLHQPLCNEVQQKSRGGGPRDASHFEKAYHIVQSLTGPIILLDDVCTSGGHLIGAHWRLHCEKSPVVLACTFGRSTKEQLENPVGLREDELDLTRR
jgi:hypothetical protein